MWTKVACFFIPYGSFCLNLHKIMWSCRQPLFNWMDKHVNEKELVSLPEESENSDTMAKKTPEERLQDLEAENKRLQKALELEKLRSKAYDTMAESDWLMSKPFECR